ncbi:hypothetical protein FD21_GL000486 [Liquorilactobacillus vini DSM 20605]|uniref:Uncharacterized protein n=1 Tax=Liquorilactobacillus vini DSM 20605 TaxID=1133569 RepID=A0A0R2BRL4_9LACO|nr:hypothetical protein FD21_GL000486 [Liquorilactobacillus vini DSM 20605]
MILRLTPSIGPLESDNSQLLETDFKFFFKVVIEVWEWQEICVNGNSFSRVWFCV